MFWRSHIVILCFGLLGLLAPRGYTQDSLSTVVAQRGDGILSLLRKQGFNPYEVYDDFIALNMDNAIS